KGLSASGVFAYQTNTINGLFTTKDYERYVRIGDLDQLNFKKTGTQNNTTLSYNRSSGLYYYLTGKGIVNYKRDFGLNHVSAMAFGFYQNLNTADGGSPYCLPYKRLHTGVEATYDYDQKYLLKADMGYSGSEQYNNGRRFITTPAISAGWVISHESFMSDVNWLSNLKLRASYGKTANDNCGLGRYAYLDNITYGRGGTLGYLRYIVREDQTGNPYVQPEVSKKQNYGIDLGFFNDLSVSVDVFKEKMDNMVINASATIPTQQGIPLGNYPATNNGSFKNEGYDVTANYTKAINKDLTVFAGGFVSYQKNTVVKSGEALKSSDYAYQKWVDGYSAGQSFGYLVDWADHGGYWISQDQIKSSGLTYASVIPRVGDLKFKDLNNDGSIDQKDQVPLGTGMIPRYYYGFSGGFNYKSFDFSVLFQGVGKYSTVEGGMGVYSSSLDGVFGSLHRNAWTAERYANGEKITAPALGIKSSVSEQGSDYYLNDRSYLRLKNLEIGYTLPKSVSKVISADKVRFIFSAQNLFTWDHMKSNDYGPEGSYNSIPVYKVINLGVNLQF
ncbi:MAG: SusC/RagA family TonB-linked outer membrane protein, partial [Bacteroidota bacterium]|nr:SusC/RagA family TonB-linked outer membrane protein [Bacteroidota bacterium]